MAIYHKWRTVFIQIPKNASTSINDKLRNRTDEVGGQHLTYFDVMHQNDPELFESYYSFAVCRNPYDRFVSAYEFVKLENERIENMDFIDFLNECYNNGPTFYMKLPVYFIPQYKFVSIKNVVLVDDIIHYENINDDWKKVVKKINKRHEFQPISDNLDVINANSIRMNTTWKDYYTDDSMKDKVYNLYKRDFEVFNYEK